MNDKALNQIVNAVLYEGYLLYPYRPSIKNQQRWTFGGLVPQSYSETMKNGDAWQMQTECLVEGEKSTSLEVRVRFLHLIARTVGAFSQPCDSWQEDKVPPFREVDVLEVNQKRYLPWQEAEEREIKCEEFSIEEVLKKPLLLPFEFQSQSFLEPIPDEDTRKWIGVLIRTQNGVRGEVEISAVSLSKHLFKLTLQIKNKTPLEGSFPKNRDEAMLSAFVSTHTMLGVQNGRFVSLMDPPEACRWAVEECRNVGTWPILVGPQGSGDTILSSPITLYDYPELAPESPGDLFDGTEIDELLSLRILTLTDEEKRLAQSVDAKARALLERTEQLSSEELSDLHGTFRGTGEGSL